MIDSMFNKILTTIMLPKELRLTLESIQDECTNRIENLNNGGCGVFAYLVCKELISLGIKAEVVTTSSTKENSPKNVKCLMLTKKQIRSCGVWDMNGLDRTHVGVRFKYNRFIFTFDSDALRNECRTFGKRYRGKWKCNYPFGDGMCYKEMKNLVNTKSYWNPMFDRNQIPLIKKIIKDSFKNCKFGTLDGV